MIITICGSIAFIDAMRAAQKTLDGMGHTTLIPTFEARDAEGQALSLPEFYAARKKPEVDRAWLTREKSRAIQEHFGNIKQGDAILVLNVEKNGVSGYIGGNTLIEMGLALYLKRPIYLWNPIPESPYQEEIIGMQPIILEGDLRNLHPL